MKRVSFKGQDTKEVSAIVFLIDMFRTNPAGLSLRLQCLTAATTLLSS